MRHKIEEVKQATRRSSARSPPLRDAALPVRKKHMVLRTTTTCSIASPWVLLSLVLPLASRRLGCPAPAPLAIPSLVVLVYGELVVLLPTLYRRVTRTSRTRRPVQCSSCRAIYSSRRFVACHFGYVSPEDKKKKRTQPNAPRQVGHRDA